MNISSCTSYSVTTLTVLPRWYIKSVLTIPTKIRTYLVDFFLLFRYFSLLVLSSFYMWKISWRSEFFLKGYRLSWPPLNSATVRPLDRNFLVEWLSASFVSLEQLSFKEETKKLFIIIIIMCLLFLCLLQVRYFCSVFDYKQLANFPYMHYECE